MDNSVPILLVTANVGSLFEDVANLLCGWAREIQKKIAALHPKFVAFHFQEIGGKVPQAAAENLNLILEHLLDSRDLNEYTTALGFFDQDYKCDEKFTALGALYLVHDSLKNIAIWNYADCRFERLKKERKVYTHHLDALETIEKLKYPQRFFPQMKWSRKGYLKTKWKLAGTAINLVNIHLFHDHSNLVAMQMVHQLSKEYTSWSIKGKDPSWNSRFETDKRRQLISPSIYVENRKNAFEYVLNSFDGDSSPCFIFGDFNFRLDTQKVFKKLSRNFTVEKKTNGEKNTIQVCIIDKKKENKVNLCVEDSKFVLDDQQQFLGKNGTRMLKFDKETQHFRKWIYEFPITFCPSYPFCEDEKGKTQYIGKRCPSWCDRVLLTHNTKDIITDTHLAKYEINGMDTCMGDHKPISLYIKVAGNEHFSQEPKDVMDPRKNVLVVESSV